MDFAQAFDNILNFVFDNRTSTNAICSLSETTLKNRYQIRAPVETSKPNEFDHRSEREHSYI